MRLHIAVLAVAEENGLCFSISELAVAIMVGTTAAVCAICELTGTRSRVSQMILTGFLTPSARQVRSGSSASTVPMPTIMALYRPRSRCTFCRAASPVIHFDCPVRVAVIPSMVMAYFITT